jgi:ligand-binding sensor domain-containing protein
MGEGVARIVKNVDAYTGASSLMAPWSALPGNDITCIFVDSKGYRWFGSDYGLSRHSGPEAKEGWDESYAKYLPDPRVSSIAEDRNGNIWIGTFGGLVRFTRGEKGNLSVWTVEKGLPSNTILDIFITQQGSLWIGTDRGAACFDGSGFSVLKTSDQAKAFPEFREFIKLKRK